MVKCSDGMCLDVTTSFVGPKKHGRRNQFLEVINVIIYITI